ncbi:MAG: CDP-alcohol phosphatidyltransferase family protein [Ilumatobacter sp.]|uniref:CDP-alcohol phosphatidyltransferase family protein n=1 Tax=Ilumatobacter sp. TaxID=1967498 RepID=UPI00391D9F32
MMDSRLRPVKDRLLGPVARSSIGRLDPMVISGCALALGVASAVSAAAGLVVISVALWLASRLADGVDGAVARESGRASDIGGLVDIVFDTVSYAAIPIGLGFAVDDRAGWIAVSVVLATFYVNSLSWAYVAALLEKRGAAQRTSARPMTASPNRTSTVMPRGLIEGTETIVLFTVALAVPTWSTTVWWTMAALVAATTIERLCWARHALDATTWGAS